MNRNNQTFLRIVTVVLAAGAVALVFYVTNIREKGGDEGDATAVNSEGVLQSENFERDTDGDGLRDWEESLWGTEPENPDTDGDGTEDGEEVESGRDPRLPGPGDEVEPENIPLYKRENTENLTTTEAFQRDYIQGIEELSENGNLTSETLTAFTSELSLQYLDKEFEDDVPTYSSADLSVTSNASNEALRAYANELGEVAKTHSVATIQNELIEIQSALQTGDAEALANLSTSYQASEAALAGMSVPEDALPSHIQILNGVALIGEALTEMQTYLEADPLRALFGMTTYQNGIVLVVEGALDMSDFLKSRNMTFSPGEPGSILIAPDTASQ